MATFTAYERPDGRLGIRNHVLVLSIDAYSNTVARNVATEVDRAVPICHQYGRGLRGEDGVVQQETLIGVGRNPNVGGVVVVGFEEDRTGTVADGIAASGKPVEAVTILGRGTPAATSDAVRHAAAIARRVDGAPRTEADLGDLFVGVECGGSDATSGLVSNPATGRAVDDVIDAGGRAAFSESMEILGGEEYLASRAATPETAEAIRAVADWWVERAAEIGVDINASNPSPDNKAGGLTTIEEKSIGAIRKAGTKPLRGVLEWAETPPPEPGLYFMDTPSPAHQSMTGLAAAGAQAVLFSTGSGNPCGSPVAPVLKVTGNPETATAMADHVDVDVSDVTTGDMSLDRAGERVRRELVAVAGGGPVATELLGHREWGVKRVGESIF
jgi:altronate dehydratase large subunit